MKAISALIRRDTRELPRPFYHVRTQQEICKWEEDSHMTMLAPPIPDFQPPEL